MKWLPDPSVPSCRSARSRFSRNHRQVRQAGKQPALERTLSRLGSHGDAGRNIIEEPGEIAATHVANVYAKAASRDSASDIVADGVGNQRIFNRRHSTNRNSIANMRVGHQSDVVEADGEVGHVLRLGNAFGLDRVHRSEYVNGNPSRVYDFRHSR